VSFLQRRSPKSYNPIAGQTTPAVPPDRIPLAQAFFPDLIPVQPPRAAILAGAFFFTPFPPTTPTFPDRSWAPSYPDLLTPLPAARPSGEVVPLLPPDLVLGWTPIVPSLLPRTLFPAAAQQAIAYVPLTTTSASTLGWTPTYPDRIPYQPFPPAAQQALAFVSLRSTDLRWQGSYPDRIARTPDRAAFALAFAFAPITPTTVGGWAIYPDRILSVSFPASQQAFTTSLFPLVSAPAPPLSWLGSYPDRLYRSSLAPWLQQTVTVQPLLPIPNVTPPTVLGGEEKIHLGTKESLGVTLNPTIGGWQAW
jgi:hypothetical protein